MRACFVSLLAAVLLGGCAGPASQEAFQPSVSAGRLVELMAQRLELAREVAWIKFQNNTPVRDPEREAALLNSLTMEARTTGLSPELAGDFFEAQIRASRDVQTSLITGWKRGQPLPAIPPRDLQTDIRPRLDRISKAMLRELAVVSRTPVGAQLRNYAIRIIQSRGFSHAVAREAAAPLAGWH